MAVAMGVDSVLTLKGTGGRAAGLRGQLRHSWLENLVLNRKPEFVGRLSAMRQEKRAKFDSDIRAGGAFEERLKEVAEVAAGIVQEASPVCLVESGPLRDLPEELRARLGDSLQELYLESSGVRALVADLEGAARSFGNTLAGFRVVWAAPEAPAAERVADAFKKLKAAGETLHEVLGRVPEGVVLP